MTGMQRFFLSTREDHSLGPQTLIGRGPWSTHADWLTTWETMTLFKMAADSRENMDTWHRQI